MKIPAKNITVYSTPKDTFLGYFGWPSLAKNADGEILFAASGFRNRHVCPFGVSVLFSSRDGGENWTGPEIINRSLLDVRDAGIIALPDGSLIMSYFTSDTRKLYIDRKWDTPFYPVLDSWDSREEEVRQELGSFIRRRTPEGKWEAPVRLPGSAPHGPILLKNGQLLYLSTIFAAKDANEDLGVDRKPQERPNGVSTLYSADNGLTWQEYGKIENPPQGFFCEPHAIELTDGRIFGLLRYEPDFSLYRTISADGGMTWSVPELFCNGSPAHLMRHSSGTIICSFAERDNRHGDKNAIRIIFSRDEAETWSPILTLRDDAPDWDHGYPSTVERNDGKLLTGYYQRFSADNPNAGLAVSAWLIEDAISIGII